MCGLTGFFDPTAASAPDALSATVKAMADRVRHRGPDDSGVFVDAPAGYAVGFRRLSIIDLSPAGHQPMQSADGRYVIAFNGEIYNFQALRAELLPKGHAFRGHSDTEVMLAAITEWGTTGALERFNGMFAFALWDKAERTLTLARDRLGEKPMYYGWSNGVFLFGSELKALRAHPRFDGAIDQGALALFLRHNYVPSPHCIYRGFHKLPPAHSITVSAARRQRRPAPYWSLADAVRRGADHPFHGDAREAEEALDALLRDAVKLRMEADVPLGAFLSGGVDSSTVVALMQAQSARPIRTFSIGFHEAGYNEAHHAKAVAAHLGTEHTELYLDGPDTLATVPRMSHIYDEPFADSSQIPTLLVADLARRHVTVSLSGDGGDELFAGYPRYRAARALHRSISRVPGPMRRSTALLLRSISTQTLDRAGGFLRPILDRYGRPSAVGDKLHKAATLLAHGSIEEIYRAMLTYWPLGEEPILAPERHPTVLTDATGWPRMTDPVDWMMFVDTMMYLPDDILVKVDRATMAVSLEGRVPLLDHRVAEFAWALPPSLRHPPGKPPKWLLKRVLGRYVPDRLVERPKMGFGVPIEKWLRGPLRDFAGDLLDEHRLRAEGLFDVASVRRRWEEHQKGERDWQHPLWGLVMFEAWLDESSRTPTADALAG